ncbi:MAG: nucleotidyltransferase domain-containing protein [Candidatus Rokubacteria bacterium]|nr:nucleotidyltransferase domain-containing protein [Candidatus Rokubacteria bacterium]
MRTASVTWFDRAGVLRQLEDTVSALVVQHPEVEEVVLFGSLATGTPVPGSDVDLLLVLTTSDEPFLTRIPRFMPTGFPVDVDVFPYTRGEIEAMRRDGNRFVTAALANGRVLFRRS